MLLSKIPQYINCKKIYNIKKKDNSFNFLSTNSKYIKKNSVLIINKKNNFKREYIYEAIKQGAIAIITNYYYKEIDLPQFLVKNINKSLYNLLLALKKIPPNNLVGITGTNGKTSVVWNVSNIVFMTNKNVKSYGTLGYYKNLKKINNSFLTTPEYEILYQKAYNNSKKDVFEFIFEVSSHSISKKRIDNFPINIAALTNISGDHLDFHKSFASYKKTKFKLFLKYLEVNGIAVLNDNIKGIYNLKKKLIKKNIKIISYGSQYSDINIFRRKDKINIKIYNKNYSLRLINYYSFELNNLSCSIGCCIGMGMKNIDIIKAIPKIKKPAGRMEEIGKLKNGAKVIVDYAHTPDALKNILIASTIGKIKPSLVFGCGGSRDKSKRKKMGLIANKFANHVYVTDDNPRNENPIIIRKSIISKCSRALNLPNRRSAIKKAIYELGKRQILIIAGKGHEKKQIVKDRILSFDDSKIAKYYLNQLNKR